jgi:hypothetical protein
MLQFSPGGSFMLIFLIAGDFCFTFLKEDIISVNPEVSVARNLAFQEKSELLLSLIIINQL